MFIAIELKMLFEKYIEKKGFLLAVSVFTCLVQKHISKLQIKV